ncbi:MAG: efflux RND transporter periplasmic adaptor subunit [Deltaproteobacteria bacterium]|nr:efflux RND transporter periplasmic adaptor subunit [Deltaproteobacteria bacterium]MCF8120554.1 efflux RND transporter periplasmic adaptor subunit [Deltaproteobacteria bacterium]
MRKLVKGVLTLLPIAAAILVVVYLVTHRSDPSRKQERESIRTLRVIEAPSVDLIPRAVGYGVAEPERVWEAVAEVKGTVSSLHPHLKSGELIEAKSLLIQIDPTEYELTIARLKAGIEETRAKIKELNAEEANQQRLLELEQKSLKLARKSLERKSGLVKSRAISEDAVDREERTFLQQKQTVQRLENSLALIPSKRKALNSALAVQQANLKQAGIDLAKTTIKAPFDCRLGDVNMEVGQFVRAGQLLFKAHGTAVTQIEARFRIEALQNILSEKMRRRFQPGLSTGAFKQLFRDVRVLVSLTSGDWSAQWEARIDRLRENVDPKTREIKVVAAVDRPYDKAVPGERPPLTAGMFCRVELQGPVRSGSVVVPRSAIHDSSVFVVDPEQRLQKRQVVVDFAQSDFVVIQSGLSGGEMVVVSDPSPAIMGMKVSPVTDDDLRKHLLALSQGDTANQ